MSEVQTPDPGPATGSARDATAVGDVDAMDLASRLKAIVAELETGVPTEAADRLTPSEKLRAIADLMDRRAATATPPKVAEDPGAI